MIRFKNFGRVKTKTLEKASEKLKRNYKWALSPLIKNTHFLNNQNILIY